MSLIMKILPLLFSSSLIELVARDKTDGWMTGKKKKKTLKTWEETQIPSSLSGV